MCKEVAIKPESFLPLEQKMVELLLCLELSNKPFSDSPVNLRFAKCEGRTATKPAAICRRLRIREFAAGWSRRCR